MLPVSRGQNCLVNKCRRRDQTIVKLQTMGPGAPLVIPCLLGDVPVYVQDLDMVKERLCPSLLARTHAGGNFRYCNRRAIDARFIEKRGEVLFRLLPAP